MNTYGESCTTAVINILNNHWPCGFRGRGGRPCVNVSAKHTKGHQSAGGGIIGAGGYRPIGAIVDDGADSGGDVSRLVAERFRGVVKGEYEKFFTGLGSGPPSRSAAVQMRRDVLASGDFTQMWNSPSGGCSSHMTCFACLFSPPNHPLPCGHVICESCAEDFSEHYEGCFVLRICPLCPRGGLGQRPWTLKREPRQTAPRILTLDG